MPPRRDYKQEHRARKAVERDRVRVEAAAMRVYGEYRPRLGWPEVPPPGLKVALAWTSLGLSGVKPLVVSLNVPQPESGPSGASVPSFIADPALNWAHVSVLDELKHKGVSEQAYATASAFRIRLKSLLRAEEAGEYAVSASSNAGQGAGVHGQGEAQPGDTEPMFGPLDVDKILAEELVRQELAGRSGLYSESAALDSWSGPVDAVALDVSGYGGYAPAEGAAQLSWGDPVAYSPWGNPYGEDTSPSVADPQWNTAGHSLVPGATEYLLSAPPADWSAWEAGDEVPVARRVSANRPGRSQGR